MSLIRDILGKIFYSIRQGNLVFCFCPIAPRSMEYDNQTVYMKCHSCTMVQLLFKLSFESYYPASAYQGNCGEESFLP